MRANDTSRLAWTLTSLAVRIAEAIGLHHESTTSSFRPFETEMRRRLWWQICDLDNHAANDRGSNPIVVANTFSTRLPLHINDEDICFDSTEEVKDRDGHTDMTFALICSEILDAMKKLSYIAESPLGVSRTDSQDVQGPSVDTVVNMQRHIEEKYLRHLNLTRPFHWFIRMIADIVTAVLWLLVYRPMKRRSDNVPTSKFAHPGILQLSVDVLERFQQLQTDSAASQFRWLSQTYVQWHALAVTIAELCVETEGPMVERAWVVVEPSFQQQAQHVADSDRGMLWRPIKKLMNRARGVRQKHLASHAAMMTPSSPVAVINTTINQKDFSDGVAHSNSDIKDHRQWSMGNTAQPIQGYQQASISEPFDWDSWMTATTAANSTTTQSQYSSNVDAMAWTNWEDFIEDCRGQGDEISGLNAFTPGFPNA